MKEKRPLTKKQIQSLAMMSNRAHKVAGAAMGVSDADEFRHIVVGEVTGQRGLTDLFNEDYVPVYNRFAAILGLPLKEIGDSVAYMVRLIREACALYELDEGYAAFIARARLGTAMPLPLDTACMQLGADLSKQVLFTVHKRGRAKLRQQAAAAMRQEGGEA